MKVDTVTYTSLSNGAVKVVRNLEIKYELTMNNYYGSLGVYPSIRRVLGIYAKKN